MNIDFNEIVRQKLAQMEAEGVIQKKIEDPGKVYHGRY